MEGPVMKTRELENIADVLRELESSSEEALDTMSGVTKELRSVARLWRKNDKSRLIKLGLTLIAFPEPTPISEILGAAVLAVGIVQTKRRRSTPHIEDVYSNFQGAIKDLQAINNFFLDR